MRLLKLLLSILLLLPLCAHADVTTYVATRVQLNNGVFIQGLTSGGALQRLIGVNAGTGNTVIDSPTGNSILFQRNAVSQWSIDTSGNFFQNSGADVVFQTSASALRANTSDGTDNIAFYVIGGGAIQTSGTRGALLETSGNEVNNGRFILQSGNNAGVGIVRTMGSGTLTLGTANTNAVVFSGTTQDAAFTAKITSSATSDLGWSVQSAANQACNTTCVSACVFGFNLTAGVPGTLLACTDATADVCLCAGAS